MKIGIVSDIHGNLPALRAVLAEFSRRRVSEVICAGDIVGYYPFVNEVIGELRAIGALAVMGNHDHAVIHGTGIDGSYSASAGVRYARKAIADENLGYLAGLCASRVIRLGGVDITLFHGTPGDPLNGRVRSGDDIDPAGVRPGVAVGGHTHVPAVLHRGGTVYVNPGSCGQPRDFDVRASCAVVDLDTLGIEFARRLYDIDSVYERMSELGFDPRIAWALYAAEWVGSSKLDPASELALAPEVGRIMERVAYRYCLHLLNPETKSRYNCYIQDGVSRVVSPPLYVSRNGHACRDAERFKIQAGAVAVYKTLAGGTTLRREHFDELDSLRRTIC